MPEAFAKLAELAKRLGVVPLPDHFPNGCWKHSLPGGWEWCFNHRAIAYETELCGVRTSVPAFSALVLCNGLPALLIDPGGGCTVGYGGEDAFIAALDAALAAYRGQP